MISLSGLAASVSVLKNAISSNMTHEEEYPRLLRTDAVVISITARLVNSIDSVFSRITIAASIGADSIKPLM